VEREDGPPVVCPSRREAISRQLDLLPSSYYGVCLDPMSVPPTQLGIGDVADDLADIHVELGAGLALYRAGQPGNAVWSWSFGFGAHWGAHVVGALGALHAWRSG
jgi:hypothetical protein